MDSISILRLYRPILCSNASASASGGNTFDWISEFQTDRPLADRLIQKLESPIHCSEKKLPNDFLPLFKKTLYCVCLTVTRQGAMERRLLNDLFITREYNKLERPVRNETEALTVEFGLTIQQIIDVVSR